MARNLIIRALNRRASSGLAVLGPLTVPCGLGRAGATWIKREGDGKTPIGRWRVVAIRYRPDRKKGFLGGCLAATWPLRQDDGWCDAPMDRNYNRGVRLPYPASAEQMWRNDHLYDVVVILDHNHRPRMKQRGSAIFLHLARQSESGSLMPTAGCVSLRRRDLALVLQWLRPGSHVIIAVA